MHDICFGRVASSQSGKVSQIFHAVYIILLRIEGLVFMNAKGNNNIGREVVSKKRDHLPRGI